ncbi:TlpA family protein disulfide reductase [Spirosoma sp. KCTC 42546]|uniref:TlpA disulfide reductase family protein n=1 Tax=Spirosoma sp. KCTC 42546 TaxID=2520506 RepID=UPI001159819B|nr:TlpA disulfide reductase family protein [Spirosoma sp. KCTC 42546]QDK78039.1 TlpA family protein disulfide reductase [Spirosoma sp. KCTC 42546]
MSLKKLILFAGLLLPGFISLAQTKPKDGFWRGVFTMAGGQQAPFNFELKGKTAYLINGTERFELPGVHQRADSLFIPVDVYNRLLAAKIENDGTLSGTFNYLDTSTPVKPIPFRAEHGKKYRFFEKPAAATVSLQGKWDVVINGQTKLIGVFEQHANRLTGTFLSTGGDLRFYEGVVQADSFALSAFDGSSPQLFKGKVSGNELRGEQVSARSVNPITGTRNAQAVLPDAYSLTTMKKGVPFTFTFPDAFTGKPVSLHDPKYRDKVVIVTLMGSWCHNCMDEAALLAPWYEANKKRGVEIIGLAFEYKNDPAFAKARLEPMKKRYQIGYDILFAGIVDAKHPSEALPALSEVSVYPTTIFVRRNGDVAKVHTGYSGPATGQYYEEFIKEFNSEMDQLLKESVPENGHQKSSK